AGDLPERLVGPDRLGAPEADGFAVLVPADAVPVGVEDASLRHARRVGLGLQRVLTLVDERVQCPFGPEVAEMAAHSDRLPAERARTPEPAEDLPPDGVVPVAEGP